MSAYDLYQLWQEAKFGGIDVSGVFHEIFPIRAESFL